ncbi:MAG: PAS domain S-box protein [Nitrospinae bacterium]|nr:PAS domain S-box protein [Nitrospinota bacterium]
MTKTIDEIERYKKIEETLRNALKESRRREAEVSALEERFLSIAQSASDAIISIDGSGNIVFWNQRAADMFGFSPDEAIGKSITIIIPERYREEHIKGMNRMVSTGKSNIIGKTLELIGLRKNDIEFPIELSISTYKTKDGIFFSGIVRDITDRKNTETELKKHRYRLEELVKERTEELTKANEKLMHSQKMEAVGHLAGGIAHDFNNILTAIMGYGTLMQTETGENRNLKHYAEQILSSAERASNLIHGLLAFSRKQIIALKPVNLNDIVRRIEKLLGRLIGEDIDMRTILTDKDMIIMADSGQIEQVLMNLCTNARDAMPGGGLLSIETGEAAIDDEYAKREFFAKAGRYAVLSVTDTGIGMDEKTKQKIFEPFFTTKEVGKGTGLGLSIIYGIIKQHDGHIHVYSETGRGTTFKIYLPIIESAIEETQKKKVMPAPKGGTETVLVAEDNTEVRNFLKDVLERLGYFVIEAADGEEAIKVFHAHRDKIKLLILDTIIPKKSGSEVYEEIAKLKPDIKILFMSGYAADVLNKKGVLDAGTNFIPKPILPSDLLRKVREALNK